MNLNLKIRPSIGCWLPADRNLGKVYPKELEDNKKEDNQASVGIPVKKWKTLEYAELRSDV